MSVNFFDFRAFDADEIVDRLFVGSVDAATNLNELQKHGITHILVVAYDLEPKFVDSFTYMRVVIDDHYHQNLLATFNTCGNFIDEALKGSVQRRRSVSLGISCGKPPEQKNGVLVHCAAGISRSISVVIAYLIKYHKMSYENALELVKSKRRWAAPNGGFQKQLKVYEKHQCDVEVASKALEVADLLSKVKKPEIEMWTKSKKSTITY